ncbi:hypothetical protein SAMN04487916_107121 [Arthrobacter sp. ov407]|uniref:hypothetical protein n=1 Tax=Arthrobacter sp. ov407 TaxID=1761748 RepID=UPI000880B0BD|nr:hypothetical protein [Arthrobacter sp. ov407]SDL26923.1 hypothetical protein SAMN04487916_107121 [Arthrobacter sp. ov407]
MKKSSAVEDVLRRAVEGKSHVVIKRGTKKADQIRGYVLAIDQTWMLVVKTRDGGYLDGFTVLRVSDVTKVREDSSFEARFLRHMDQWPPAGPSAPIDLSGPQTIITSAAALQTLVTLYTEQQWPDECYIGAPVDWEKKRVWLLEVDGQARWERDMSSYRLKQITRIEFGGDYEKALIAVAGPLPPRTEPAAN